MAKSKLRKVIRITLLALLLAAMAAWLTFVSIIPRIAQAKIKSALEAQGLGEVRLLRPDVGLYRTTLANLSIGNPAKPNIELASATVTYSPRELLSGRVQDVILSGLLLRLDSTTQSQTRQMQQLVGPTTMPDSLMTTTAPTTTSTSPATEPLFRSAKLTNGRLEMVDPQTGLPSSVLIDAQAKAAANRTIDFAVSIGFGGMTTQISGTADAAFEKIDANVVARGVTLDLAQPFIGRGLPVKLNRPAQIDASIHVDRATEPRIDLPAFALLIPSAAIEAGAQKTVELTDVRLSLAGSLHKYDTDWYATLSKGPAITIASVAAPEPLKPVPFSLNVAPSFARFNANGWSMNGSGATIEIDNSRFGVDVSPFAFGSSPDGALGSISASLREVQIANNPVVEKIIPEIRQWNVSGKLRAGMSLQAQGGTLKPRVSARLENCSLDNRDYELKIQGINAALSFIGFSPLQTSTDQTISAKYIEMGKWEILDADAKFAMPGEIRPTIGPNGLPIDGAIVNVTEAKFGWAGGDVWCAPFQLNLAQPRIRTELGAKDLDLSKVLWIASNKKAWAEGLVDLRLWADYSWPDLRFGKGWAASRPDWRTSVADPTRGQSVALHLPDSAQQLDNWLRMRDPRFQDGAVLAPVRSQLVGTIDNFYVDDFHADFSRTAEGKQLTAIRLHGGGRETDKQSAATSESHKLDLSVAVTDLDILISHFLKVYSGGQP